jgi:hypothetical protein
MRRSIFDGAVELPLRDIRGYLKSLSNTRLAVEIKSIDDDIAKSVEDAKVADLKKGK